MTFSSKMISEGKIKHTSIKCVRIIIAANILKVFIGIIGLKTNARKATHVVLDVTNMALADRLIVYAILCFYVYKYRLSPFITMNSDIVSLCRQASIKT